MQLMADTTDNAAPPGYDRYAGYIDGAYRSFGPLSRQYPGRVRSITVLGDPAADIADVEVGDLTPATAPRWLQRKGANRFRLWVAAYGPRANPFPGAAAWQKIDHGPHGENIDVSELYYTDDVLDVPWLYCPMSWVGDVLAHCHAAGQMFVPVGLPAGQANRKVAMPVIITNPNTPAQLVVIGGTVFALTDTDSAGAFLKAGAVSVQVSAAEWEHFANRAV